MKLHLLSVLTAFFVTILWSSSWVIIKFGLDGITPLSFAALRYRTAFTLWNFSLRHLKAVESTIINSTMLPQIVILALIFLNELPTNNGWIAITIIFVSALLIQVYSNKK